MVDQPTNSPRPLAVQAFGAIKDALDFVEAAQIIDKAKGHRHLESFRPIYFLLSHAIELVLKAYLLDQGTAPRDLKNPAIRHNLEELLKKAQGVGFQPAEDFVELIKSLGPHHQEHTFRYRRRTGRVTLPLPMKVIERVKMEALLVERVIKRRYKDFLDRTPTSEYREDD